MSWPDSLALLEWSATLTTALCVVLAIAKGLDRVTKLEAALANVATCATPPKDGDRAVVTILHHKGQLVTSCQLTTNWKQPERIGK